MRRSGTTIFVKIDGHQRYLVLQGTKQVIDVATKTGATATIIASNLPNGWLTGIDFFLTVYKLTG